MSIPDELYNGTFAKYIESIEIMYLVDDDFKMICNDYCYCKNKIEKYNKNLKKYLKSSIKGEKLSQELQEEIIFYLIRKI